jgi:hypothetical protein
MNTTDYIKQLIQEIKKSGSTIPEDLLLNNLNVLVLYARLESQQETIEATFRKPIEAKKLESQELIDNLVNNFKGSNISIIGDTITEPNEINEQN